jgi:hypothetical protein
MFLTLDIGNSQIFGGVYDGEDLKITFRQTSSIRGSSDEFGAFFRITLRENGIDPENIEMAATCSVVPDAVHSLRNCFRKYFRFEPFVLQPGVKTGLKIRYGNRSRWAPTRSPIRWGRSAVSGALSDHRRLRERHHAVRGNRRERLPRRNHHTGDRNFDGGARIEDGPVAGG